jgi:hypothetical protein
MKSKDEFPEFLQQFLIDFRESSKTWKVVELCVLCSDNAGEFNSAEVQQICRNNCIKREFSNPSGWQQFRNGKAEKCIGDVGLMTKTSFCSRMFQ